MNRRAASSGVLALALVLVIAQPAGGVDRITDPAGDAATGPDIEQIIITPADTDIAVQVMFTTLWQSGWSMQILVGSDRHGCSTLSSLYAVALPASLLGGTIPGAALLTADGSGGWSGESPLDHRIDGTSITITLPRSFIGDPDGLVFSVVSWGGPSPFDDVPPDQDHSPDGEGCHSVDVRQAVPDTAMRSHSPIPIVFSVLAVLVAIELIWLAVPTTASRHRPRGDRHAP